MEAREEIILNSDYVIISANGGVMKMCCKNSSKIDLKIAQQIYLDRLRASKGLSWPILFDFRITENLTQEAKDFYSQDYTFRGVTAVGLLFSTPIQILIYNFYLAFYKPPVPFKAFACEKKAIQWLSSFTLDKMN